MFEYGYITLLLLVSFIFAFVKVDSQPVVSLPLYEKDDPVENLDVDNFNSVFRKDKGYFVEFYIITCPICVKLRPAILHLGHTVKGTVIQIEKSY